MSAAGPTDAVGIARALVAARINGIALTSFPGPIPTTLEEAYEVQKHTGSGLGLVPTGWKVGAIASELQQGLGAERFSGPIVNLIEVRDHHDAMVDVTMIHGAFAAIEAEIVFEMGRDLPNRTSAYSTLDLASAIRSAHIAVEVAGSSLSSIMELGPTAVVADCGNNLAVAVGNEIRDWRERSWETLTAKVSIDGNCLGRGSAENVPGGPVQALAFFVSHLAEQGVGIRSGDLVSTGAMCGVHKISSGSSAHVDFGSYGTITVKVA